MKTVFALAFLAIIAGAFTMKVSEIDRSAFGKNLLDTILLELETGDNAQTVLDLLQQVHDEIVQEQIDATSSHVDFQSSCSSDLDGYNAALAQAEADHDEAQADLDRDEPLLDQATEHLGELEQARSDASDALDAATELIESQRADFSTHSDELNAANAVFQQAKSILQSSFATGSFLQTSVGSALANHFVHNRITGKYEPFARILAQAASSGKLTAEGVDNVISLLDRLIQNTADTLSTETEVQQQREATYADVSAGLESQIDDLSGQISDVSGSIETLTNNIATWHTNLDDAEARIELNTGLIASRTAECNQEQANYDSATSDRSDNLEIIGEVTDLISSKVADFTQYITSERAEIHID